MKGFVTSKFVEADDDLFNASPMPRVIHDTFIELKRVYDEIENQRLLLRSKTKMHNESVSNYVDILDKNFEHINRFESQLNRAFKGISINDLNEIEIEDFLDKLLPKYKQIPEKILVQEASTRWKDIEKGSTSLELEETPAKYKTINKMVKSGVQEKISVIGEENEDEKYKKYEMEDYEISDIEREYLISKIKNLKNPTPRRMRIFYYKYLIMKQLLHNRLEEKMWNSVNNEIVDVLIHFSNAVNDKSYHSSKSEKLDKELIYVAKMVSVF